MRQVPFTEPSRPLQATVMRRIYREPSNLKEP